MKNKILAKLQKLSILDSKKERYMLAFFFLENLSFAGLYFTGVMSAFEVAYLVPVVLLTTCGLSLFDYANSKDAIVKITLVLALMAFSTTVFLFFAAQKIHGEKNLPMVLEQTLINKIHKFNLNPSSEEAASIVRVASNFAINFREHDRMMQEDSDRLPRLVSPFVAPKEDNQQKQRTRNGIAELDKKLSPFNETAQKIASEQSGSFTADDIETIRKASNEYVNVALERGSAANVNLAYRQIDHMSLLMKVFGVLFFLCGTLICVTILRPFKKKEPKESQINQSAAA